MKTSLFKSLYFQVLTAIAIGILLGHYYPELGAQMKPLGDAFVKLIKMVIAPVIFCTVVTGISRASSVNSSTMPPHGLRSVTSAARRPR